MIQEAWFLPTGKMKLLPLGFAMTCEAPIVEKA